MHLTIYLHSQTVSHDKNEVEKFYQDHLSNLDLLLGTRGVQPTHIVLFGSLYEVQDSESRARKGCEIVYSKWNGFDLLQDDARRRGGVVVLEQPRPS
jgi:hypothetical protein